MGLHMDVKDKLVYRIIPQSKSNDFNINDRIPIPTERDEFPCSQQKKDTEDCFEKLRADSFSNLPSRKSSLFVLPHDQTIVDKWLSDHYPHDDYDYTLCELRISGTLIWCDEDKFTIAGSMPLLREAYANDYWEGAKDSYESFDLPEGLFRGEAILITKENKQFCAPFPKKIRYSAPPSKPY